MNMNKLVPWNWFKKEEADAEHRVTTRDPFDRFFDDFFRNDDLPFRRRSLSLSDRSEWFRPRLDIAETEKEYTVTVELPGVEPGEIQLDIVGDTLRIRGEKKQETEKKGKNYHCVERSYGSFHRTLALPEDVDADAIDANFKKGVMHIVLPRKPDVRPDSKKIDVKTG